MIGKEIADALAPFAMWGAIGLLVVGLVVLVRGWIQRGAKREAQADIADATRKDEQDAESDIKAARERSRARWRRNRRNQRVQHAPDDGVPPA